MRSIFIGACTIASLAAWLYEEWRSAQRDRLQSRLWEKWDKARRCRKSWKMEHSYSLDFNDPEYQKFWELEIGAEMVYNEFLFDKGLRSEVSDESWTDFCKERIEAEGRKP